MFLIVGLGNPSKSYQNTYHNLGFSVIDKYAEQKGVSVTKNKDKSLIFEGHLLGAKVILAKPQTYMNLSGQSVVALINRFKIQLKNVLIVYDDADVELGHLRYRSSGSAGTHNGMKNIVELLGHTHFARLRVGVGKPLDKNQNLADFVLSDISTQDAEQLEQVRQKAVEFIDEFILKNGELENKSK